VFRGRIGWAERGTPRGSGNLLALEHVCSEMQFAMCDRRSFRAREWLIKAGGQEAVDLYNGDHDFEESVQA